MMTQVRENYSYYFPYCLQNYKYFLRHFKVRAYQIRLKVQLCLIRYLTYYGHMHAEANFSNGWVSKSQQQKGYGTHFLGRNAKQLFC
jgi:hypothetical protein